MNSPDRKVESAPEDEEFCVLVAKCFDADYYLQTYVDVTSTGLGPLEHWLSHGFRQGRQFSRFVLVRVGTFAKRSADRNWKLFHWRETDIALRFLPPIAADVTSQIFHQGRHDPAILAPGPETIRNLIPSDRESVHLNVAGLQQVIRVGAEFLLIAPGTDSGQCFTIALVAALNEASFGPIQTIITDQESAYARDQPSIPKCFQPTKPVFWRDFWIEGPEHVKLWQLAQLIRVLQPRVTIISGSRHGYETVARFGRCLVEHTKLFCVYTADDDGAFVQYPGRTLPYAAALTDSNKLAAVWHERYGDLLGHGVVTLPGHSSTSFLETVTTLFKR
jgi:hypothetical protein